MSLLLKKPYQLHSVYGNKFVYPQRVAVRQCSKKNSTGKWVVAKTPDGVREIPHDYFLTNSVLATEALITNSEANADKVKKGTVTQNAVEKLMKNRKEFWKKRQQDLKKSHEKFLERTGSPSKRKKLVMKRSDSMETHPDTVKTTSKRKKKGTKRKPNVIKLKRNKKKKQVHHDECVKDWPRIGPDFQAALPDLNPVRYEGVSFATINKEMDTLLVSLKARLQEVC